MEMITATSPTNPTNPANYRDINWELLEAKPSRGLDDSVDAHSPAAVEVDNRVQRQWLLFVATFDSQSE